jgi:hypothetical protein
MAYYWKESGFNFVCRAKENMAYEVVEEREVPKPVGRPLSPGKEKPPKSHVISDQVIRLKNGYESYPENLRLVTFWAEEEEGSRRGSRAMKFYTNNFKLSSATIAAIYKERWKIEAFFKLIKQNLKIKSFLGTSANAVKIQIYSAMISFLLARYLQVISKSIWCIPHLLVVIRALLYVHIDLMYFLDRDRPSTPPKRGRKRQPA